MSQRADPVRLLMHRVLAATSQALHVPWVWAGLLFAGIVVQFSYHPWEFLDTPYLLYLAKTLDFREIVINGFTADVEYRPLFRVGVDLIYGVVGANLAVYKTIIVVQFAGVLWCLIALFRVSTGYQALAACLALSCFVGLHTSSILLSFFPLSHHSFALLGLLATAVLCMSAHRSWYPACYFAVCLLLPFTIELGLLLPPMLVSLWWAGAPGVQRRDVAWGLGGVALYVIVRATFSSAAVDVPSFYTESGFGFGEIDPDEFSAAFGRAPYLFWVYNVMANLMTVLFSEPRGGTFDFIRSLSAGTTPPWQWIQIATSLATTSAGVVVLTRRRLKERQRQLLVLGCVLLLSNSLLGFLYARDRVSLAAGAGYAVLVFLMASLLVESGKYRRAGALALVVVLLAGWTWRSAEAMFMVRDRAFEAYADWMQRDHDDRRRSVPDPVLLATLHAASIGSPPPDPHCTPEWTKRYFQRRLNNLTTDCGNPVIHVRWVDTLGDIERTELERSLDLYRGEHSEASLWRYQVPDVSPGRLGTIVTHAMVDDLAGFDDGLTIHVRWVENLRNAQRNALERSLGLYGAEHHEGSTWRYQVPDASPDRFDMIATHDMVDDTYGFDPAADVRFGPVIHLRWAETLRAAQRTALERSLGLFRAEHTEGTTWRYRVPDSSPDRLRAIVAHDMVADTNGFDRGSLELDALPDGVPRRSNPRLVYASGWYPVESDPEAPEAMWRWTKQIATLSFANPNADAAIYLDYTARPEVFARAPQTVTVRAGDQVLQSFVANAAGRRLRRIPLTTTVLGTEDRIDIHIDVDRTFVPANLPSGAGDRRQLGIQVYHTFVVLR